jgi:hypothetical protein
MRYIKPDKVNSPKSHWLLRKVLHDGGQPSSHAGSGWSAAIGQWKDSEHGWTEVLALRWNGNKDNPLGNPQSRGLPTWFIVPPELAPAVRSAIVDLGDGETTNVEKITLAENGTSRHLV